MEYALEFHADRMFQIRVLFRSLSFYVIFRYFCIVSQHVKTSD